MNLRFIYYIFILLIISCLTSCERNTDDKSPVASKKENSSKKTEPTPSPSISIPLKSSNKWEVLKFSSIPPHKVQFSNAGLTIQVDKSAAPIIYPLSQPINVKKVEIAGTVDQLVSLDDPSKQGESNMDDFNLRLGFVLSGSKTLSWFQKKLAPDWIIKLHSLAKEGQGVDHIYFLNATINPAFLNKERIHPLGKGNIKEKYVWTMDQTGDYSYSYSFQRPKNTLALWISSDGDDTQSKFNIVINRIILHY